MIEPQDILSDKNNIGKYFKIAVNNPENHPKMKYEKHLIEKYPDKYSGYELTFTGKLCKYGTGKYCRYVIFDNVDFIGRNKIRTKKEWYIEGYSLNDSIKSVQSIEN